MRHQLPDSHHHHALHRCYWSDWSNTLDLAGKCSPYLTAEDHVRPENVSNAGQ